MAGELFNVVQFFENDTYEYVRRNVTAEEAMEAFRHYISSIAAKMGMVKRVIITDDGDSINAEWERGKGVIFPTPEMVASATTQKKSP